MNRALRCNTFRFVCYYVCESYTHAISDQREYNLTTKQRSMQGCETQHTLATTIPSHYTHWIVALENFDRYALLVAIKTEGEPFCHAIRGKYDPPQSARKGTSKSRSTCLKPFQNSLVSNAGWKLRTRVRGTDEESAQFLFGLASLAAMSLPHLRSLNGSDAAICESIRGCMS